MLSMYTVGEFQVNNSCLEVSDVIHIFSIQTLMQRGLEM